MDFFSGLAVRWLESIPVVVTVLLTAIQVRHMQEAQKLTNQLEITKQHREIWSRLYDHPEYGRILEQKINLTGNPITNQESLFVTFLINHLKVTFRAKGAKMLVPADALRKDVQWFFSLPIPSEVWSRSRNFQDREFAAFVDESLHHLNPRES